MLEERDTTVAAIQTVRSPSSAVGTALYCGGQERSRYGEEWHGMAVRSTELTHVDPLLSLAP